jgi:LPS-assembly lipoprotein
MSLSRMNGLRAALAFALIALAGCQVRPLYSAAAPNTAPNAVGAPANAALNSIAVKEVDSRLAQEVRNHLIFALSGGAGEPASPAYTLDLGVTSQNLSAAVIQNAAGNSGQPTAGTVVLTSIYVLRDNSGKTVASGRRSASASFDRPLQQFASLRALRDAENRAARELADILKLALAADLSK